MTRPSRLPVPPRTTLGDEVVRAADALARGEPILLFDRAGREEETDLLVAAEHITPAHVRRLRQDGGGLVFVAVAHEHGAAWGLPFAADVQEAAAARYPLLHDLAPGRLPYDAKSSFSLWVNHRDTFTGITDRDRAMTIRALAELAGNGAGHPAGFAARFRAPGHVALCVAQPRGPLDRQGHTELAVALAAIGGATGVVAGCEMLAPDGDAALSPSDAEKYALRNGHAFLDGTLLIEAYETWREEAIHDA